MWFGSCLSRLTSKVVWSCILTGCGLRYAQSQIIATFSWQKMSTALVALSQHYQLFTSDVFGILVTLETMRRSLGYRVVIIMYLFPRAQYQGNWLTRLRGNQRRLKSDGTLSWLWGSGHESTIAAMTIRESNGMHSFMVPIITRRRVGCRSSTSYLRSKAQVYIYPFKHVNTSQSAAARETPHNEQVSRESPKTKTCQW